jgi:hypothetical protein
MVFRDSHPCGKLSANWGARFLMRISLIIHKCGRHEGHPVIENALSSSAAGSYPTISKRAKGCCHQPRIMLRQIGGDWPTRKEPIRGLDTRLLFALSWAARGGDAVCGKLVNEIVGLAERHQ